MFGPNRCSLFPEQIPPFPGWKCMAYRLSRAITQEDIDALLGNQDLYVRESGASQVLIIHKYGVLEINCILGEKKIEVWFDPENAPWASEYLDALLATRF